MRKGTQYFFVLLALASLGLVLVPNVSSQPENIKVVSYSYYVDNLGYFDVVGEVQNVGSNTIESVILSGTVYTSDGTAQAYSYPTNAWVKYLLPQQKAPFYMEFPPQTSVTGDLSWMSLGVDHVDFVINEANATSSYQYPDLAIVSSSGGVDAEGTYWVTGTVKNTGSQTATNVRVIGTFYNASGTVVAVGYTNTLTPSYLSPSDIASFKVGAFDLNQTLIPSILKVSSYSLLIQAEGPVLSGVAPTLPPSTPTPSGGNSSPTQSPGSDNRVPIAPETQYVAVIVIVLIGLAVAILLLRRRSSRAKVQTIKSRKSQTRKKHK
ncbi:hypothetical protein G4O51_06090 [Candidatus Bathyarchaeota archaeon A05DMB-2]|jgi:hypothetical protein|nr:hypothetical protein [Candidatus Bathyarchaeota archaeon A05DMB-2]